MKRVLILLLGILMMLAVMASCSTNENEDEEEDKGAIIPVYLSSEIANFDPAYANVDDGATKILGLIYEGLYKYDENGKVVAAQAKSYKVLDKPDDNYYAIDIKLKTTYWSDGTQVQAADYIFAWKRIIDPGFRGEAASLLFDIKNARKCNSGECSIDDLGVSDSTYTTIHIEFEGPTNYDKFIEYLASPCLVPLRENAINKVAENWSSNPAILVCNGPFTVKSYTKGSKMILERNMYYMRNIKTDKLDKYVTPFRLYINLEAGASGNLTAYNEGNLAYISELPLDQRAALASKATVKDTMSVMSVLFNTKSELLSKSEVRVALSKAVDRNAIVNLLTFAKPAEGLIADGVFNTGWSKKAVTFRSAGKKLLEASADVNGAKTLLSNAGVKKGEIKLAYRDTEADAAVAEYLKSAWESLGLTVTIKAYSLQKYVDEKEYDLVRDKYIDLYDSGEFDAILIDYTMFSTDAFANLASFAKEFAGGYIDMTVPSDDYSLTPHISGYDSEAYSAKIEEAFAEKDADKRAALLHEAEEMLMNDMPILPLVQLQNAVLTDGSNFTNKTGWSFYGFEFFDKANISDREKYVFGEDAVTTAK